MAPAVLHRVIHGTPKPEAWQAALITTRPAILHDHCRHKVLKCDYPAVTPEKGKTVRGTYVDGLTTGDIWRLDTFEGDEYERRKVTVKILYVDQAQFLVHSVAGKARALPTDICTEIKSGMKAARAMSKVNLKR
jgi:Gamma-glutamyl cyclotransferase, AIG2-like